LAEYEPFSQDRFANYIEALEFLLVPDSIDGELAFKFRMRGTILFGRSKLREEREHIYKQLKDAYDLRSAIVHGNNKRMEKIIGKTTWEEITKPIRNYTRDAIKFFFKKGCLDDNEARTKLINELTIFNNILQK
jgi:hypothetical protein